MQGDNDRVVSLMKFTGTGWACHRINYGVYFTLKGNRLNWIFERDLIVLRDLLLTFLHGVVYQD